MMRSIEALQQRWEDYRPTKSEAISLAIACVAATLLLGFGVAGWVSGSTAQKSVADASQKARNELAAAVCADRFMRAENVTLRLAKLNDAGWYDRSELLMKGGWATMPDRKEPDGAVAGECAFLLDRKH